MATIDIVYDKEKHMFVAAEDYKVEELLCINSIPGVTEGKIYQIYQKYSCASCYIPHVCFYKDDVGNYTDPVRFSGFICKTCGNMTRPNEFGYSTQFYSMANFKKADDKYYLDEIIKDMKEILNV